MPQMAPIWWTTLFLMFILSFLIVWVIMYSQVNTQPSEMSEETYTEKEINWKW